MIQVGELDQGDQIKWFIPTTKVDGSARIVKIRKWVAEDDSFGAYVEFYEQHAKLPDGRIAGTFLRSLPLSWITHKNGRRVSDHHLRSRQSKSKSVSFDHGGSGQLDLSIQEEDAMGDLKTSTRKSLDEMSESHRLHIEKWEPHLEFLRGEHVWASVSRVPGRGVEGPVYVALKRGAKDYVIADYDTAKQTPVTKSKVLDGPFESSGALMEAFKKYRLMAKEEREARKGKTTKAKKAPAKPKAKPKPKAKAAPPKRVRKPRTAAK